MGVLGCFDPNNRNGLQCLRWATGEALRGGLFEMAHDLATIDIGSYLFTDIVRNTGTKMYKHRGYTKPGKQAFHLGLQRYIREQADCKFQQQISKETMS